MKYFVIHSGADYEPLVKPLIQSWSDRHKSVKFVLLCGTSEDWESDAIAKIRETEKVLYLVGENSNRSANIKKELAIAQNANKSIFVYRLDAKNEINKELCKQAENNSQIEEGDADGEVIIGHRSNSVHIVTEKELEEIFLSDEQMIYNQLMARDFADNQKALEQYKLFVKTSEDLVKRKQTVNSFYVSLNSILLGAIITLMCTLGEFQNIKVIYLALSLVCALIGSVLCFSWISLLNSYADLNASKMTIIKYIEETLAFNLYDTEWAILSKRIGKKKYKSFSRKEKMVAYLFAAIYVLCAIGSLVLFFVLK